MSSRADAQYMPMEDKSGGFVAPYDDGVQYLPASGQESTKGAVQTPPPAYNNCVPISTQPLSNATLQQSLLSDQTYGLESLVETGVIRFKQEVHITQMVCGCDMPIEFDVIDESDRCMYRIQEREDCCARNCIPQGFRTKSVVSKTSNAPVLTFQREARCVFNCCLPCCCFPLPFSRERLSVLGASANQRLGVVQQDFSAWTSRFTILNATEKPVLRIEGPGCNFGCGDDIEFQILNLTGLRVGSIVKHYSGLIREVYADFDNFTINFPRNMDVSTKATLLGAVSLINFLFFQGSSRRLLRNCCVSCCCTLRVAAMQPY